MMHGVLLCLHGSVVSIVVLGAVQEHNEAVERYDARADAWSVVQLAPGAEPFKRAFMSCCVL